MARPTYGDRLDNFEAALDQARRSPDSEPAIIEVIANQAFDGLSRGMALGALGETAGPAGSALLRQELHLALAEHAAGNRSKRFDCVNVACASIGALQRREGPAATPEFLQAEPHPSEEIHVAGLTAMALDGDDRVWDEWLARLAVKLSTKGTTGRRNLDVTLLINYLARHSPPGSERAGQLINLLRDRWNHIQLPDDLEYQWPGITPGGSPWKLIDLTTDLKPPRPGPPRFARRTQ